MRISLCMIVRDEARSLERCLRSAMGVADEVCVVDTGSRDTTPALARELGARVADFEWCDDYARARNASLELARGDWILVLDADEAIRSPGARARLESFAAEHGTPGHGVAEGRHPRVGQVWIRNHSREGPADEISRVAVTRFFPRDGQHAFQGRIHEQLTCAGRTPERASTGVEVDHWGYTAESLAGSDKSARYRALLEASLDERPDDPYLWYKVGRTFSVDGRHDAALAAYERALSRCPDDAPYAAHLMESAAYALRALGRSSVALSWMSRVERRYHDRADTCFLIALLSMDVGDLRRAEEGFQRCLTLGAEAPGGGESSVACTTFAPAYNLGVMREVLGRWDEALELYRRALAHQPEHGPSLQGIARLRLGRQPGDPEF